jgi:hypothetical protein
MVEFGIPYELKFTESLLLPFAHLQCTWPFLQIVFGVVHN